MTHDTTHCATPAALARTIAQSAPAGRWDSLADDLASFDDSPEAICAASADAWLDTLASDLAEFAA